MKSAFTLTAFAAAAAATNEVGTPTFAAFATKHGKRYASKEELHLRRSIYAANVAKIQKHNAEGHSWTMGINKFADLTVEEFKMRFASGKKAKPEGYEAAVHYPASSTDIPASFSWLTQSFVPLPPVKNQGQCGSCWTFATVAVVESVSALKTGTVVSLSEQQIVDCDHANGNSGCNGGEQITALDWVVKQRGLCSEASYPYTAADGTCKSCTAVASITSAAELPAFNATALTLSVMANPTSISLEADGDAFQFYSGGVLTDPSCWAGNLDHAVTATGFGTLSQCGNQDCWEVRNSWGADWGMKGYIYLGRNGLVDGEGICGMYGDSATAFKAN